MAMPRVEVITSVERRRRWSRSQKEGLVAASLEPGVTASEVARAAGIHTSQLFRWRKELCPRSEVGAAALVPVQVVQSPVSVPSAATAPASDSRRKAGVIEIDLGSGRRVRVDRDVDAEALRRVLDVLGGR